MHTHTHTNTFVCECLSVYIPAREGLKKRNLKPRAHRVILILQSMCTYIHIYMCTHSCTQICMYVQTHIYKPMYTHIHT